mmetsp:Transcript_15710/g.59755  ORF Transcript_15710/g.59755 Transcript_15710/m.59755 type:complete len:108 (-) Transcript_15710:137-460(-)
MNRAAMIETVPADAKLAKRLFTVGCFFLPWLWIVNALYFWARIRADESRVSEAAKPWIWRSTIGGAVSVVLVFVWAILVQLKWEEWGLESILVHEPDESDGSTGEEW